MNAQQMALAVVAGKWDMGTAAGPPGLPCQEVGLGGSGVAQLLKTSQFTGNECSRLDLRCGSRQELFCRTESLV